MTVTLYYLPLRARMENARLVLAYGNVAYDYVELSFAEWGVAKPLNEICNFNQLPAMKTEKGTVISQSGAILRYCAKIAGCFPADIDEAAEADMIVELTQEMNVINPLICYVPLGSDAYKEKHATYFGAFPAQIAAGATAIVVTLDKGGCEVFTATGVQRIEGHAVPVVDVTGAGDTFSSSFMFAYTTTRDAAESARFANAAAAMSVGKSGARGGMTTEPDVRAFLARHTALPAKCPTQ